MIISKYQKEKIERIKDRAKKLYRQGFTTREVGKVVGKSHQTIAKWVKELSTVDKA